MPTTFHLFRNATGHGCNTFCNRRKAISNGNNAFCNRRNAALALIRTAARRAMLLLAVACAALAMASCISEDEFADNPRGNFEALWRIMDEHYCFFAEKQVDWDSVHTAFLPRFDDQMSSEQMLEVMGDMLATLRDGHVNLFAGFDYSRYWGFHENYPSNYQDTLITHYLGTDYRIASGLRYRILDDNVGYVRCATFESELGQGNLDNMLAYLAPCRALIIDVRSNGGGMVTAAEQLASRFINEKTLVGYMRHKTGRGHDDFSAMREQWLRPSSGLRWQKPVAVLTNRGVFSAANEFVKYMRCCPRAIIVGDQTGGGAGLPFTSELPNGWTIRFSACPMYDRDGHSTENGIQPDHRVGMTDRDLLNNYDSIIDAARRLLTENR